MTRFSVGSLKGSGGPALKPRPNAGSKIGRLYDYFITHPLEPVVASDLFRSVGINPQNRWSILEYLRQYELDIRPHSWGKWWLVAANGRDFMAERLEAAE